MRALSRSPARFLILFLLVVVIALTGQQPVAATGFPGPDAAGYIGQAIAFNLRDVSGTGTFVALSDDQVSGAVALPFPFTFYGNTYNELFISSNGFVTFTRTVNSASFSRPLPQADGLDNVIAGYWEDLNRPQGNIRYATLGAAPNREFVVGYYSVPHFSFFGSGPRVTFEIILHEGTNDIELQYGDAPSDGGQHSAGIENSDGTIGLQVAFGNVSFRNQGFHLHQHQPTATIAVNDDQCPIRAEMTIADDEGHTLSGAVNVYSVHNEYPDGVSEIRLELLHTQCGGTLPATFSLAGTVVEAFAEGVPQPGQPAPGFCTLTPGVETRIYDDPAVLALWNPADGATNTFSFVRGDHPSSFVLFAWARVRLSGPGQPGRTYCVGDIDGGDCTELNLSRASNTPSSVSASADVESVLTLATSAAYTDSTLPGSVDLRSMDSDGGVIELTASDGLAPTVSASAPFQRGGCDTLSINNTPPTAVCQGVTVPTDPGMCSAAAASIDGGSSDLEGPVTLEQSPAPPYALGDTTLTLTATDSDGATDSCQATVTVVDQTPPTIDAVSASPNELWPPNHDMIPVTIAVSASDFCDAGVSSQCEIVSAESDEPDDGLGDGRTASDIVLTGPLSLHLRAERAGNGDGRTYTITVRCTDASGNSSTQPVTVDVPHSQR